MDDNPKENMEKSEEYNESAIRQRIIMAVRQKAGLAGSDAGIEVKLDDTQADEAEKDDAGSSQAQTGAEKQDAPPDHPAPRAPLRFWNRMDNEGDDHDIDREGIGGPSFGQSASAPATAVPPGPLNDAIRHQTIALEPLHRVRNPYVRQLSQLDPVLRDDPRLARPAPPGIQNGEAAQLLEGLIAECHFLMRELVLPSAMESADPDERRRFLSTAMELAQTGATVAKTVAKLRRSAPPASARVSEFERRMELNG